MHLLPNAWCREGYDRCATSNFEAMITFGWNRCALMGMCLDRISWSNWKVLGSRFHSA
jgi:hypothetical protein